jgi:hypothetical protein
MRIGSGRYLILITAMAVNLTCKKTKPEHPAPSSDTIQTDRPDKINGVLLVTKIFVVADNKLFYDRNMATAIFCDTLFSPGAEISPKDAGTLFLNGTELKKTKFNENFAYVDTTANLSAEPFHWTCIGNQVFPYFSYNYNGASAEYSGYSGLPDTLFLYKENIIDIGPYKADEVTVTILLGHVKIIKKMAFPEHIITLGQETISYANGSLMTSLYLYFSNSSYKEIRGMIYKFETAITVSKQVIIKEL